MPERTPQGYRRVRHQITGTYVSSLPGVRLRVTGAYVSRFPGCAAQRYRVVGLKISRACGSTLSERVAQDYRKVWLRIYCTSACESLNLFQGQAEVKYVSLSALLNTKHRRNERDKSAVFALWLAVFHLLF